MPENTTDALIDKNDLITITDKLGIIYAALRNAIEDEVNGCLVLATEILAAVMSISDTGEYYVLADLLAGANDLTGRLATSTVAQNTLQPFIAALNTHCSQRAPMVGINSIQSIDSFAGYWNGVVFNDVLFSPDFRDLYSAAIGAELTPANCYSPEILQGSEYPNAMGKWAQGSGFTDGAAVNTTKYGMAKPKLKVATALQCTVGQTMTITVSGKNHTGASATWTYVTTGNTLNVGEYDFAETDWIQDVTNIEISVTGGGSVTQGVLYVEGRKPMGRP